MLPVVTYVSAELQERIDRWDHLSWHIAHYGQTPSTHHTMRWLWDEHTRNILVFADVKTHEPQNCMARILMPSGIWLQTRSVGMPEADFKVIENNMGLKRGTLLKLDYKHRTPFRINVMHSRHELRPGKVLSQWVRHLKHERGFDYKAYYAEMRKEVPGFVMHEMMQKISEERFAVHQEQNRLDWRRTYAHVLGQIERAFEHEISDMGATCVDNMRVARVGDRQHHHRYMRQKKHGCCGSHDFIVTLSDGQYHLGFNYGH